MIKLWNKSIAGSKGKKFDPKDFLQAGRSRVYKISPKKVKFFNTVLFPDEKSAILKFFR